MAVTMDNKTKNQNLLPRTSRMECKASIIIPSYNSAFHLDRCIKAIFQQTLPQNSYEVIVVDDGSTDNTKETATKFPVHYFYQKNQGPAQARNMGARHAQGDILVFVDADCEPFPNWLEELLRPFENRTIHAAQGCYRTRQTSFTAWFAQKEFEERYQIMQHYPSIDLIATYSAAFRRETFFALGGFDPAFPQANNEDTELSYRFCKQGHQAVLVPTSLTYHQHPDTLAKYFKTKFWRAHWRIMVYRRFPSKALKDRYTTMTLKVQTLLMLLSLPCILLSPLKPGLLGFAALLWAMLIASGQRLLKICLQDPPGRFFGPFCITMLLVRSLALGLGSLYGLKHILTTIHPSEFYQAKGKRILDLMLTVLILALGWPVMVTIGLLVRLTSPGPIFFRQKRIGLNGQPFTLYKFRTMHTQAPAYAHSPADDFADPRVTRIGRILRTTGLDELPQLFNVLKGDMSLVGPRPEMEFIVQNYPKEALFRLRAKPGLTGPWQISPHRNQDIHHNLHYDRAYIKNMSLALDLAIIAKTILLTGKNILIILPKIFSKLR